MSEPPNQITPPRPRPGVPSPQTPLAPPPSGPPPVRRQVRWGWLSAVLALSVVTVLLAVALALVGRALSDKDDQLRASTAVATQRTTVLAAATSFAVKFGSYDYQHLDADFAATSKLMTPDFAASYVKTSTALTATLVAYKTQVTASVPVAAVVSVKGATAEVLVLLDQVIKSSQTSTPKINRNRLVVDLQLTKGAWLVAKTDAT